MIDSQIEAIKTTNAHAYTHWTNRFFLSFLRVAVVHRHRQRYSYVLLAVRTNGTSLFLFHTKVSCQSMIWSSFLCCVHYILSKRHTLILSPLSMVLCQAARHTHTQKHKRRDLVVSFIDILFRCSISEMIRLVNRNKSLNAWHIWQNLRMQILDTGCCYCEFQLAIIIIIIIIVKTNASSCAENNSELKRETEERRRGEKKNRMR